MIVFAFSDAAKKIYPFADVFGIGSAAIWLFYAFMAVGAFAIFVSILVWMFAATTFKKSATSVGMGILMYFFGALPYLELKDATIFDAPGTVVGTVQKVHVIPGGFFTPDASNVTFADGTGMSFKGGHALPVGATIIKKANAWAGDDYYTAQVQEGERPSYFTAL